MYPIIQGLALIPAQPVQAQGAQAYGDYRRALADGDVSTAVYHAVHALTLANLGFGALLPPEADGEMVATVTVCVDGAQVRPLSLAG